MSDAAEQQLMTCEADIANMQSALVAAGHEPGCPVVHAASVDCVPGSGCIDWRARAERAEAVLAAAIHESHIRNDPGWRSGNAARRVLAMQLREAITALDAAVVALDAVVGKREAGHG